MKSKLKYPGFCLILFLFSGFTGCSEQSVLRESQPQLTFVQDINTESGEVRGIISDFKSGMVVTLENEVTLFTCHPDPGGEFWFKPVEPGIYSLHLYEADSINPCSIRGIVVRPNEIVNLGQLQIVL